MFKTFQGVTEDSQYRGVSPSGDRAGHIRQLQERPAHHPAEKCPSASCQIGKSFRNEITPGNFTFRTREFEQMELEFFCKPGTDLEWFDYWKELLQEVGCSTSA